MIATLWDATDVVHALMVGGASLVLCVWGICIATVRYQGGAKAIARADQLERALENMGYAVEHSKTSAERWEQAYTKLKAEHPDPPKNILPADATVFDPDTITPTV